MPLYHFNVQDEVVIPDLIGQKLPDLSAAKIEAVKRFGRLMVGLGENFWERKEWSMQITDERGLVLFTLFFFACDSAAESH